MKAQSYKQNLHIICSNNLIPGVLYNKVVLLDMIFCAVAFVQVEMASVNR